MHCVVFQGLGAPLCLRCQHRLAEAIGQTKLHHRQRYQSQNLKTLTRSFEDKEDRSAGVRTRGGETEKTEKERQIDISTHSLWVSIQVPTCVLSERTSEGVSILSTTHQGDQAQKSDSCTLSLGMKPKGGHSPVHIPVYRNLSF